MLDAAILTCSPYCTRATRVSSFLLWSESEEKTCLTCWPDNTLPAFFSSSKSLETNSTYLGLFRWVRDSGGSRGPWGPGAPCPPCPPRNSSKSCSFQAILRENPLFWANVLLRAPLGVKTPLGPPDKNPGSTPEGPGPNNCKLGFEAKSDSDLSTPLFLASFCLQIAQNPQILAKKGCLLKHYPQQVIQELLCFLWCCFRRDLYDWQDVLKLCRVLVNVLHFYLLCPVYNPNVTMVVLPTASDVTGMTLRVHSPYYPCNAPGLRFGVHCAVTTEDQ